MTTIDIPPQLEPELLPIAVLCDGQVSYRTDGWRRLILMQGLGFYVNGTGQRMDALLCLNHDNATYPTKLYFPEQLGSGLNWNDQAHILGKPWFSFSWSGIPPTMAPVDILAAHLAPLNQPRT